MAISMQTFIFTIEGQRYGLNLEAVHRVERAAEVTKVPDIPELITGIIDYQGKIIPVFDLRKNLKQGPGHLFRDAFPYSQYQKEAAYFNCRCF